MAFNCFFECNMTLFVQSSTLYGLFTGAENRVAGGEGSIGFYGSLTADSVHRIFSLFKQHGTFDGSSRLVDVGAGLGRPLLHAYYLEGIHDICGIEIDPVKCIKAEAFAERVGRTLQERHLIPQTMEFTYPLVCSAIEDIQTIEPATHLFTFWEGWSHISKSSLGDLFRESHTLQLAAIIQRAVREDPAHFFEDEYGFGPIECIQSMAVTMSGSGRKFVAYIMRKKCS